MTNPPPAIKELHDITDLYDMCKDEYRRMFWWIVVLTAVQTAINVVLVRAVFGSG